MESAPFSAGPRRFVLEETEDGVWGSRQSRWDVWPGAQRGVAVGIPAPVLRVPASASPDLWSSTPAPTLSFMCFHSLLRPATQFYSLTLPLWPTSWTLPLWALAMISFSISFGSCFTFFLCRCGEVVGGGDRVRGLENQRGVGY